MQKMLVEANKMPHETMLSEFKKDSDEIKSISIACRRGLKKHMKDLQQFQKTMFKLSETKIDIADLNEEAKTE